MHKLLSLTFIFLIISGWVLVGLPVGAQEPIYGGTLRVALPAEPPGLDPTTNTAAVIDRILYGNLYEGLVKISPEGNIVPALAEEWAVSSDGTTYTFYLRKGVKFHNGKPFTAQDVKFTLDRNLDSHLGIVHPEYYRPISDIKIADSYTVQIKLKKPNSMFLFNLARGDSIILPEGAKELVTHPVGTGPFKFGDWKEGAHINLIRNEEYYHPELPYLKQVKFVFIPDPSAQIAALKAGDIDVIAYISTPEYAPLLAEDPKYKVLDGVTTTEVILAMNNSRSPFKNPQVRQALAYGVDKNEIIQGAMFGYGKPIGSLMSPLNPNYIELSWLYPYDPKKAKELLAQAGYPDGFKATLTLPRTYNYSVRAGKIIKDQLSKIGIDLNIQLIGWPQWLERVFTNAQYDLTIIGHAEAFDISIYSQPTYYFRYDNPYFQEIINQAERATDQSNRQKYYAIAQWIIARQVPTIFLFVAPSLPAMRAGVMNWWINYPLPVAYVGEVWKASE